MPNQTDIARHFGINPGAVSKALNGSSDISAELRKKILDYAEEIGFNPKYKNSTKGRVTLLWGKGIKANCPLSVAAEAFCETAEKQKYAVDTYEFSSDFDFSNLKCKSKKNYLGTFALDVERNSLAYQRIQEANMATVFLNEHIPNNNIVSSIMSNDIDAATEAIDYLAELGHHQIGFVGIEQDSPINAKRFVGYFYGLKRNALSYRYDLTFFGERTRQSGEEAADYYLSVNKNITAFVFASDAMAEGFISYMRAAGKQAPKDFSIITFCDSKSVQDEPFAITSIVQDYREMGRQAFNALQGTMRGYPAQHITVCSSLVAKDTTCAPKN